MHDSNRMKIEKFFCPIFSVNKKMKISVFALKFQIWVLQNESTKSRPIFIVVE